jgi:hypothetical protein
LRPAGCPPSAALTACRAIEACEGFRQLRHLALDLGELGGLPFEVGDSLRLRFCERRACAAQRGARKQEWSISDAQGATRCSSGKRRDYRIKIPNSRCRRLLGKAFIDLCQTTQEQA